MTRDLDLTPINDIMDSTIFHLLCSFTLTRYTHTNPLAHCFTSCKLQTTVFGENAINILKGPHPSWRFGKPLQSEPSEPCSLSSDSFTDCHLRSTRGFIDPQTGSYIAKKTQRTISNPETHSPKWSTMKSQIRMVHWPRLLSPFIEAFCFSLFSRNSAGFSRNLLQV